MTVNEISKKLSLKRVSGENAPDREVTGCHIGDLLSLVMSRCNMGDIWITVQGNINVPAVCTLTDAAMVIIAEGMQLDKNAAERAQSEEIPIFLSDESAYSLACKIKEYI